MTELEVELERKLVELREQENICSIEWDKVMVSELRANSEIFLPVFIANHDPIQYTPTGDMRSYIYKIEGVITKEQYDKLTEEFVERVPQIYKQYQIESNKLQNMDDEITLLKETLEKEQEKEQD